MINCEKNINNFKSFFNKQIKESNMRWSITKTVFKCAKLNISHNSKTYNQYLKKICSSQNILATGEVVYTIEKYADMVKKEKIFDEWEFHIIAETLSKEYHNYYKEMLDECCNDALNNTFDINNDILPLVFSDYDDKNKIIKLVSKMDKEKASFINILKENYGNNLNDVFLDVVKAVKNYPYDVQLNMLKEIIFDKKIDPNGIKGIITKMFSIPQNSKKKKKKHCQNTKQVCLAKNKVRTLKK